ncbi:MAG: glycosyltransferase family 92 protein [Selenomonadaceae bacterium]|nr:glycosyltransferase family 92 protein [Selenomonadaceae bacterium]
MKEDASLFRYELAFTIIIKNGAPYMREWIDFHRLAGVDHFYFYDNDSTDNLEEVLKPYIDSGVVEYEKCPGKRPQCEAYNRAVKSHRFDCRYMGFIDDDEFVYPTDHNQTIKDVLHEVLDERPNAVGLTVDRYGFGSSGHEKADYSVDVLDRFQHRQSKLNNIPKNISNPRAIALIENMHYINFFDGKHAVNSRGELNAFLNPNAVDAKLYFSPQVADKIIMNHYYYKSREEWLDKLQRGDAFFTDNPRTAETFDRGDADHNDVFDDEIVKYRDERRAQMGGG